MVMFAVVDVHTMVAVVSRGRMAIAIQRVRIVLPKVHDAHRAVAGESIPSALQGGAYVRVVIEGLVARGVSPVIVSDGA